MLFVVLMCIGTLLLVFASHSKWQEINQGYRERQHSLVKIISSATHSLFVTQEMMLDILGNELIQDETYRTQFKVKRTLDDLLVLNPSIVAFGLATPEGKLNFVSSNLNSTQLPNLKEQPESRESFIHALEVEKMVLGRTYYMDTLKEWVIPIRKAIRDDKGRAVAVMTAGLRVRGTARLFRDALHSGSFHTVRIIRDYDYYEQFHSADGEDLHKIYAAPALLELIDATRAILSDKFKIPIEEVKKSEASYDLEIVDKDGMRSLVVVQSDNRYELWTVSTVPYRHLIADFHAVLSGYLIIFVLVSAIIFALFRFIAKTEGRRRKELIHQVTHDALTQLPNRGYLQQAIGAWIYPGAPGFTILYVDMDHFKSVNDSFGHEFGDKVLCELAARIRKCADNDTVIVRQGGDEFLILTPQTETPSLIAYAQHLIDVLSAPCRIGQFSITLGASIGIARYPENGENLDVLLRAADIAMYESKRLKHSFHLFSDSMQEGYLNRLELERHLRTALENDELFMVYQPQIDTQGEFVGVESLLRWNNAELGLVPPHRFIPVAESSGLMITIGNFVLTRTLTQMQQLQQQLGRTWQVSINISVRQFMQTTFLEELKQIVEASGMSLTHVTLEITESLFIEDVDYILHILESVHRLGVRISMDDFGTGYSSLSMLRKLPIDELKIDKSFVDTILNDRAARKMIQNIIAIGKNLDMSVLAEGVETVEQEAMLKSFECDCFQGYYYSKPLPFEELGGVICQWPRTLPGTELRSTV